MLGVEVDGGVGALGYEQRGPDLEGKMTYALFITTSGRIANVVVEAGSLEHEKLRSCTIAAIKKWRFPRAEESATVTFSVVFSGG